MKHGNGCVLFILRGAIITIINLELSNYEDEVNVDVDEDDEF